MSITSAGTRFCPTGRRVPTFRNARHLMGRVEFDYWKDVRDPALAQIFDDSVRPVADGVSSTASMPQMVRMVNAIRPAPPTGG
jgi:hypothetical protein